MVWLGAFYKLHIGMSSRHKRHAHSTRCRLPNCGL